METKATAATGALDRESMMPPLVGPPLDGAICFRLAFVSGHLQASGFCDPEDSHVTDLALWLPATYKGNDISMTQRPVMELETCRYIMKHIGGKFCELVQEEREALQEAEKTRESPLILRLSHRYCAPQCCCGCNSSVLHP